MAQPMMQLALDENGNPFIIIREQEKKQRIKGVEAHKANIAAAKAVASTLKSSLGPRGMDKIIISPDGDVTVTNDGATILEKMPITHQCAQLLVQLSKSQDDEVGDGTTGVVVLAGALLEEALGLIEKGLHPLRVADGYDKASKIAVQRLEEIAKTQDVLSNNNKVMRDAAMTALGSKVVSGHQEMIADLCLKAVLSVVDWDRKDVNFDLIQVQGKPGASMSESNLVEGVVLDKDLSHSQMRKETKDARIAILTCPFEPPKPKTKHKLEISTVEQYKELQEAEQQYFRKQVELVKAAGANFVICQWGFDDEGNHLLMANDIPSVRWVGGTELELIALATKGQIVPRFEELTPEKLGHASLVQEVTSGTASDEMIVIKGICNKTVTLVIRASGKTIVEEAKRSVHDALCCLRNLVKDPRVVPGGGASEIAMNVAVEAQATEVSSSEQFAIQAFADALMHIPHALADNSGLDALSVVPAAKASQLKTGSGNIGIDCKLLGQYDMLEQGVHESFQAKRNQILLATQVVKMILKIDDVIRPAEVNASF